MRSEQQEAQDLAQTLRDVIRLAEHDHKLPLAELAKLVGIPRRTLEGHVFKGTKMGHYRFIRLLGALPNDLASRLLEHVGKGVHSLERQADDWMGALKETCALDADIADAAARGMTPGAIEHLKDETRHVIAKLQDLVEA